MVLLEKIVNLKRTWDDNVKMGVAFLWQTQIQTTKYGIYDMIRIKKKEFLLKI